MICH